MENNNSKQKTFCLVQLTRIGDIIQTVQLAKFFKAQHPNIRLILLARESFSTPLSFLTKDVFDKVYTVNTRALLGNGKELVPYLSNIKNLVDDMSNENIDVLINYSYSKTSNYFCSLIKAAYKLGTRYGANNQVEVYDQWSQIIYSHVMGGDYNPFSLIDIYKNVLGIETTPEDMQIKAINDKKTPQVVLHPFASHKKKHWKANKWVEVLLKVFKINSDFKLIIVGSKNESASANLITNDPLLSSYSDRIENRCGQTNLEELYQLLCDSTHFIGHDSMVGHLAKLAELPTLTLSLGTVRPIETIPYGKDSYLLAPKTKCFPCFPDESCSFFQCHADISYQGAASAIDSFVKNGHIDFDKMKESTSIFHLESMGVYQSQFQNNGYLYLKKLDQHHQETKDIFKLFLRIAYLYKFKESEEAYPLPEITRKTHAELLKLMGGIQHLYELCEFGKKYSKGILVELSGESPSIDIIKEYSQKIDEIDQLQELLKTSHVDLVPIIDFYNLSRNNLPGENIVELSELSYGSYQACAAICSIIYELSEKTISEYKIKSSNQGKDAGV